MEITLVNAVLIVVIAIGAITGLRKGLVRQAVELAGLVASYMLAMVFGGWLAAWLELKTAIPYSPCLVIAFITLFIAGMIASHFIAVAVQRLVRMSFLGWVDRLLGAMVGVVVGVLVASLLVWVTLELPLPKDVRAGVRDAEMTEYVRPVAAWIFDTVFSYVGEDGLNFTDFFKRSGTV